MNAESLKETIKRELPGLLRDDPGLRAYILDLTRQEYAGREQTQDRFYEMLGELRRDREEQSRKWDEQNKQWKEQNKQWKEQNKQWKEHTEEQKSKWDEQNKRWKEYTEDQNRKWDEQNKQRKEQNKQWKEHTEEQKSKWEDQNRKWDEQNKRWKEHTEDQNRKWDEQNKRWKEHTEDQNRKWDEQNKRWKEHTEDQNRKWDEQNKHWKEHTEEQKSKWDGQTSKWEEQNRKWYESMARNREEFQRVHEEIMAQAKKYDRGIGALGARWGIQSEAAFRNALAGILEKNFDVQVLNVSEYDDEGGVFGRPDQVELDVIIKNGLLIICELKSSIDKAGMYIFERKARFYEKHHQRKADRLIVISPMIDARAQKVAKQLGIETYSDSVDVEVI